MAKLLMPKATAIWLIENTILTFEQISEFCGLHIVEIQALADGNVEITLQSLSPITNHQLSTSEIKRCEDNPDLRLVLNDTDLPDISKKSKGRTYVPIAKRAEKPDSIAWCINNHPELSDGQIQKLIGTTKNTVVQIRQRSHWNIANLNPRSPAELNLCSYDSLQIAIDISIAKAKKREEKNRTEEAVATEEKPES